MNLVFKEYIKFLQDNGVNTDKYNLKEGYYWLDNQIIKCFDKQGEIHKVLRILIDDKLNINTKEYKNKPYEIESWNETVERNKEQLEQLENDSLKLIKQSINGHLFYMNSILSSGGKDSSVVTYLVRKIQPETEIIFNNTSLDCADTYLHIKSLDNIHIINPYEGFYQWRKRNNFIPTRFARACCSIFKEGAMVDNLDKKQKYLFFMGMRNEESNTRGSYGDTWKNEKWGNREWEAILPIRKWTEIDIWLYILLRGININAKYKKGYARVGCSTACPFYSKSTWILDKYWYPKMYNRWQNILINDFNNNHKALIMNCTQDEYLLKWNGGIVREEPTEEVVKEFAEKNDLTIDVAKKYFNHTCQECEKRIKNKEVLAMNLKYLGRNTNKFYCKKHLKSVLGKLMDKEYNEEDWINDVQKFKEDGCGLF